MIEAAPKTDPVIEVHALSKHFGALKALDSVDLTVRRGAIGLLGPNGAGKSTFLKCLLQLLPITSGTAKLLGREVGREGREIRKRVGYTPEQDCHIPGMVGCEYVTYCAQLCGLPFQAARQRAHEMLDFVGMGQERYRKIDTYSTGMKQRLKLAQAIVHDPEIVFLDEPTNGLDPKGQVQILELIQGLWRQHGICVMLSSHLLHDVDRICDQIIIIARGKVLVHDTLQNLKARRRGAAEVVVTHRHEDLMTAFREKQWACELLPNGHVRVEHQAENLNPLLNLMDQLKLPPLEIIPSPNALEEMFVQALETSMPLHNSSYQHWDGQHLGIWWRRAVIAGNGLKGCLQNKWMRHVITLCWAQSLAIAAVLFMIGQLLVSDSVVVRWLSHLNPQLQSVGDGLISWLVGHPEISVRTEENVLFFFCCRPLMLFSLVAIILALPHLITRDLSSRAIIVYSSKAVGRIDYLIGKFGTIFGLLFLTWMGPLCVAWLLGNLLAPNWHFFWHSRVALGNTLLFVFISMVILSALGLGVSAMAQREKSVVGIWLLLWLAASSVANIPHQSHSWLKHCSFAYNLDQIQYAVFRLPNDLKLAQDNIPLLGGLLREIQRNTFSAWEHPELSGALIASAIMIGLAALIIAWRVKPE